LTFVKMKGGRTFAHICNRDEDTPLWVAQQVVAAEGSSRRLPTRIAAEPADDTVELSTVGRRSPRMP
jgi:hypothetical protein